VNYLSSRKNLVGLGLAIVGLLLVFAHVIGPFWPLIVVGLYLVGAVLTPRKAAADLPPAFNPNDVRQVLDRQISSMAGRLPPEVMAKVLSIRQIILGILPQSGNLPPGSPELYILERTATDYLPTTLHLYLSLPGTYAAQHQVQDGKTPKQLLLDQLGLLEGKMNEVAEDVHRNDADRLLTNGRFLEERFGRSTLSLEPPTT
jgi:hypothetical protein